MRTERIARLPGPPERVRRLFRDVESWPEWLPGVRAVEVEERDAARGRQRVVLDQTVYGRPIRQVAEIETTETGFRQRRVGGQPKRWDLDWSFEAAEDGGTRTRVEIGYDFGLWAALTPRSVTEGAIEEIFDELVEAAAERLDTGGADGRTVLFRGHPAHDRRIEIVEDERGLRVVLDGVTYRAEPVDAA